MSRFNVDYSSHMQESLYHNDRLDEQASQSGSDDGTSYVTCADAHRTVEADLDEEANSLTSQTLNPDGTPKRPMNAFMIFARRRRPQVSAENQSMRTGEVSKILSREWNSMEPSEKQFYLDQAKLLKDNFNSKYPDYVYRRRPNNSRKRKKNDGTSRHADNPLPPDLGDEFTPVDFQDASSIDSEDHLTDSGVNIHPTRLSIEPPSNYASQATYAASHSRSAPYAYPMPEGSYRSTDSRVPYQHSGSLPVDSTRLSQPTQSLRYSYAASQNEANYYPSDSSSNHSCWDSRVEHNRTVPPVWSAGTSIQAVGSKLHSYSPTSPQSGWSSSSGTTSPASATQPPGFPFPTLNSPFYPNQSQLQGNYVGGTAAAGSPHPNSPSQYSSPTSAPSRSTPDYGSRGYAPSSSVDAASIYHHSTQQDSQFYQESALHRGVTPLVHSTSHHSLQQPSSSASSIRPAYWPRDR